MPWPVESVEVRGEAVDRNEGRPWMFVQGACQGLVKGLVYLLPADLEIGIIEILVEPHAGTVSESRREIWGLSWPVTINDQARVTLHYQWYFEFLCQPAGDIFSPNIKGDMARQVMLSRRLAGKSSRYQAAPMFAGQDHWR